MERWIALTFMLVGVLPRPTDTQNTIPETVLNCCEGDVLFLLDSSGSVSSFEFHRMLRFLSELLRPFSLGPGQVRVGLLQVGTEPRLEFGFGAHSTQRSLQGALQATVQLQGDTNTAAALRLAQEQVLVPGGPGGARAGLPRVLVWLTDGVQPGAVEGPMADLREEGVAVLAVSTGHANYQVLRRVVTPPSDSHLYFVDIEDISLITKDLRDAIIELIRAERLQVRDVTSNSAVLQWRPVLSGGTGYYDIRYGPHATGGGGGGGGGGHGTSTSTSGGHFGRITRPGDATSAVLRSLQQDTTYTATLTPESNVDFLKPLSVTFRTLPEVLSPTVVTVSESRTNSVRVSWGPLQPNSVQRYQVEYSPLPRGEVQIVTADPYKNSTLLTQLRPDTQYLVTVSALHSSGQERAMSVKVCTQEELPALKDLELTTVGSDSVQVRWRGGGAESLRGYWVSWEGGGGSSGHTSSLYLPPSSLSTLLTHLAPGSRVCVSPVYRTARGEGLCCTAHTYAAEPWGHGLYSYA
ncbi:von Willebrand factor A domain-containing protein 1-like isoform X2 [Megalops cyprinoides]|uniref:von Willebrand factor A domain-containing protein 1-like isoform X2 n=1 Tax=Megalops cyprinoides TaxID=118141 RepID=UPI0018655E98|nr:von Willebrand factor A domain-containing protein 1-like isoform X2 [Megalops cyprinoides]